MLYTCAYTCKQNMRAPLPKMTTKSHQSISPPLPGSKTIARQPIYPPLGNRNYYALLCFFAYAFFLGRLSVTNPSAATQTSQIPCSVTAERSEKSQHSKPHADECIPKKKLLQCILSQTSQSKYNPRSTENPLKRVDTQSQHIIREFLSKEIESHLRSIFSSSSMRFNTKLESTKASNSKTPYDHKQHNANKYQHDDDYDYHSIDEEYDESELRRVYKELDLGYRFGPNREDWIHAARFEMDRRRRARFLKTQR